MVTDIPIPNEIFQEFQPFGLDKENVARLFDNFDYCVLCNDKKTEKDMPSQTKGQNCLDRYFTKVNLNKDINDCIDEMGKNNTKNNAIHQLSSSSGSESEMPKMSTLKKTNQKNIVPLDENSDDEGIEFDSAPSKPIIAAMNALGKLKQGIAAVNIEDNSSRDSTALVIDEEQLEPEKGQSSDQDEPVESQHKTNTKRSSTGDGQMFPKNFKDFSNRNSPVKPTGSHKPDSPQLGIENETLSFSQFLNSSKNVPAPTVASKFSTSTPVEGAKGTKRKRVENADSTENPVAKKNKDRNLGCENDTGFQPFGENMDNLVEIKNLKDGDCPLFLEDFDSDDELYVVQCPKEVNLESIVGKQVDLNGESILKLEVNGKKRPYECFSQKDSMGRHINMILPSRTEGILKFGVYQLNGSVVLSESIDEPDIKSSDNEVTGKSVPLESLKDQKAQDTLESKELSVGKHKKHKKKHDSPEKDQQVEDPVRICLKEEGVPSVQESDSSSSQVKKKKKKREIAEEKSIVPEQDIQHDNGKPSKKKKKVQEEDAVLSTVNPLGDQLVQNEKKARKKKKENEEQQARVEQEPALILGDEQPIKKKKKKKHRDETEYLEPEIIPQLPLENFKKELSPQESTPSEESPMKKRKKKKDKEKNEESDHMNAEPVIEPVLSAAEPVKKKKKKKHHEQDPDSTVLNMHDQPLIQMKHIDPVEEDIVQVEDVPDSLKLSTFIETDTQHIKKKKKKKKKKEREKSLD